MFMGRVHFLHGYFKSEYERTFSCNILLSVNNIKCVLSWFQTVFISEWRLKLCRQLGSLLIEGTLL